MNQKTIYPFGTVLKVVYPVNQSKATFCARCIVVDGKKKFPDYYNQLLTNIVIDDLDEFIAVEWDKGHPNYNGAEDGFYLAARFDVDDDQTDFRMKEEKEIKNNEGRDTCFRCAGKTKIVQGFSSCYSICPVCKV